MKKAFLFLLTTILCISLVAVFSLIGCQAEPVKEEPAETGATEEASVEEETSETESSSDIQTEVGKTVDIAFVTFMTGIPYFDNAWSGALAKGQELGISMGYYGPASNDTPGQIAIIDDLITKGVNAIIVTCMDSEAVAPTLIKARNAGIVVITWDLDVSDPEARSYFANLCSNEDMGEFMADCMYNAHLDTLGDSYEWAMITSSLTSEQMIARANYIVEYIEETYPGLKFMGMESGESDAQKNYNAAVALMQANPDLKAIMSNASDALGPIAEAIAAESKIGQVYGTGMTTPNLAKPGFESGAIIGGAMLWSPAKWAAFAVTLANEVLNGVTYPFGESFEIPGFSKAVQVASDEFQYNELIEFTKENINDFDF